MFDNATNFTLSGGKFNTITGDLNEYNTTYTTYTSGSYNHNPDRASHAHYHPYAQKFSRGPSSPWRPQYSHEEYGYARYSDDVPPRPERQYEDLGPQYPHEEYGEYMYGHARYHELPPRSGRQHGGYDDLGPHNRSRSEASMRSPAQHVELTGGEFNSVRGGARRRASTHDSQAYMNVDTGKTNVGEDVGDRDAPSDTTPADTTSDETDATSVLGEPTPLPETFVPAVVVGTDLPQSPRGRSHYERMRRSMAGLDINDGQTQAEDAPPSLASDLSL